MQEAEDKSDSPRDEDEHSDHRYRMRFQWNDLMEDLIEDGRRRGLFDDLQGKGKPLDLEVNVYEGEQALANKLLKTNDITPAWLTNRMGVVAKIEDLRSDMKQTWDRYQTSLSHAQGDTHRQSLKLGWNDTCERWQRVIDAINKEIDSYNLKRPRGQQEIFKLRLGDELKRISAPRYLF